jgi:3-phenylpropionate/trans-cinnamate dioxygenase ferredoxin subunit
MSEHRLCAVDDLENDEVRRFDVAGQPIAVVRIDDRFYAIGDTCSHANVSLSEGEVHADTCELECWKHGSTFSLVTGAPSTLPATRPVPTYATVVRDGDLFLAMEGG